MKRLHLLRHAKSSWDAPDLEDIERPLAERGHRTGARMARHLHERGLRPDLVLCSMAVRARQTFDFVCPLVDGIPVLFERRLYVFSAARLLERLRAIPDYVGSVLVVGHNPAMQELILELADGSGKDSPDIQSVREKFPTAAFATLDCAVERWADLDAGSATLAYVARPKDL